MQGLLSAGHRLNHHHYVTSLCESNVVTYSDVTDNPMKIFEISTINQEKSEKKVNLNLGKRKYFKGNSKQIINYN